MTADKVVQAYVHRVKPTVEWPQKELEAFSRITLDPGVSKTATLEIPVKNLRYWNEAKQIWDDDLCDSELLVGASSGNIKLKKTQSLE